METMTQYDLLNRYLQAVRKHLPAGRHTVRQDDILAELSANIQSQMEDTEAELNHPLSEREQAVILKQNGHPMLVAARYWPQQHLIGPALFPAYWHVLKIALLLMVLVNVAANAVLFAVGMSSAGQLAGASLQLPWIGLTTFAWVTLIFAGLDFAVTQRRASLHIFDKWDPLTLHKVKRSGPRTLPVNALLYLIPDMLGLLWWLLLPHHPWMIFGPAALFLTYSPAVHAVYLPILLLMVAKLALDAGGLLYARQAWQKIGKEIAEKCMVLISFQILYRAQAFVVAAAGTNTTNYQRLAQVLNSSILVGLKIGAVAIALMLLWDIGKLVREKMQQGR